MSQSSFAEIIAQLALQDDPQTATRAGREADAEADGGSSLLEAPVSEPVVSATPISPAAIDLLIASEVSSRAFYEAKLTHPIWPGNRSGVTIGIGYDVGTVSPASLARDWTDELGQSMVGQLAAACGVLGQAASALATQMRAVTVPWDPADRVFLRRSVPVFVAMTERALPNTGLLSPDCLGALVSLAYNRGPSFSKDGDRFREMRAIRDHMADRAFELIPGELRSMQRIWTNEPNSRGLLLRREAEALLFERGLPGIRRNLAAPKLDSMTPMAAMTEAPTEGVASWV